MLRQRSSHPTNSFCRRLQRRLYKHNLARILVGFSLVAFLVHSQILRTKKGRLVNPSTTSHKKRGEIFLGSNLKQCQNDASLVTTSNNQAVLCTVMKNETLYVDDWVKYHTALGFDQIQIYDNSQEFDMKPWLQQQNNSVYCRVTVKHFPQAGAQNPALSDCANRMTQEGNIRWISNMDVDEYLVLFQHDHLKSFLKEYANRGAIAIYWKMMGTSGAKNYEPLPMVFRSMMGDAEPHELIKSVANLQDVELSGTQSAHFFTLKSYPHNKVEDKMDQLVSKNTEVELRSTSGKRIPYQRIFHHWYPTSLNEYKDDKVALVYHYGERSIEEVIYKRKKGRVTEGWTELDDKLVQGALAGEVAEGDVFDDRAWKAFVRLVPEYKYLDTLENIKSKNRTRISTTNNEKPPL